MLLWNGPVSVGVEHRAEAWHGGFPVGRSLSALPFEVCLACRVCSLVGVILQGTQVHGSHGTPINSPSKREPLRNCDTGLSRWEEEMTKKAEEKWSVKGKMKDGQIMYFMFTRAHLTICLSGIWQAACSLHYFFFSINWKVWTLHYKIPWQDNFPVAC